VIAILVGELAKILDAGDLAHHYQVAAQHVQALMIAAGVVPVPKWGCSARPYVVLMGVTTAVPMVTVEDVLLRLQIDRH
jgi:hypothetical protein